MPEMKLTERRIRELEPPVDKPYERYWDTEVRGLCVKVHRTGRKKYEFKTRINGKSTWATRAPACSGISLEDMRDQVKLWNVDIINGIDPFERKATVDEDATSPTVSELCSENREFKEGNKKRPLSDHSKRDLKMLSSYVDASHIGNMKVKNLRIEDAFGFLVLYHDRPRLHDRLRWWMLNCYEHAIRRGYVPMGTNPWRYVDKQYSLPEPEDLPRFTDDEIGTLGEFLRKAQAGDTTHYYSPTWIHFMWFLIRNGTRPGDTRIIERSWIDVVNGQMLIRHPNTKTGKKIIYLSAESAREVKSFTAKDGNPFLFPAGRSHLKNYATSFTKMRSETGLDKPPYAIRRWFASTGRRVYKGEIKQIQGMVGWESEEMALRYAGDDEELLEKAIMENAEVCRRVADRISDVLERKSST